MDRLQRKIMRGIYYAYILRLASLPGVWQGTLMMVCMVALTHFVSLGNVIQNFLHIEKIHTGRFVYNAISTTEAWTIVLVGVFMFAMLSFRFTVAPPRNQHYRKHAV